MGDSSSLIVPNKVKSEAIKYHGGSIIGQSQIGGVVEKKIPLTNLIREVYGFYVPQQGSTGDYWAPPPRSISTSVQGAYKQETKDSVYNNAMVTGDFYRNSQIGEEDHESEGPEKWTKEGLWPTEKWTPVDEANLDLAKMYDATRKDLRKEIKIPKQVELRNGQLGSYIKQNFKVNMHETALPCILNSTHYKGRQANQRESKILSRLQQRNQKEFNDAKHA